MNASKGERRKADPARPLLTVERLTVRFETEEGGFNAVDCVDLEVGRGEVLALVGESGCGKTVTAHAILRLLASPPASVQAKRIELDGQDLLGATDKEMRAVRGGAVGMIFQEPMTSLNPVYTIGWQVAEAVRLHSDLSRKEAHARAVKLLELAGFPRAEERYDDYPHELSGGLRQRVMIAISLAGQPQMLIADEPTTALDSTVQAQILDLLGQLQREREMGLLLISHDIAVVAQLASRITVLYAGQVVESGMTRNILDHPLHPYTQRLLASLPPVGTGAFRVKGTKGRRLPTIEGVVPDLTSPPVGCRFHDRCPSVLDRCFEEPPPELRFAERTFVRCWLYEQAPSGPTHHRPQAVESDPEGVERRSAFFEAAVPKPVEDTVPAKPRLELVAASDDRPSIDSGPLPSEDVVFSSERESRTSSRPSSSRVTAEPFELTRRVASEAADEEEGEDASSSKEPGSKEVSDDGEEES